MPSAPRALGCTNGLCAHTVSLFTRHVHDRSIRGVLARSASQVVYAGLLEHQPVVPCPDRPPCLCMACPPGRRSMWNTHRQRWRCYYRYQHPGHSVAAHVQCLPKVLARFLCAAKRRPTSRHAFHVLGPLRRARLEWSRRFRPWMEQWVEGCRVPPTRISRKNFCQTLYHQRWAADIPLDRCSTFLECCVAKHFVDDDVVLTPCTSFDELNITIQ